MNNGPLLTTKEVAADLQCSRKTLLGHVKDGSLRYVNVGRGEVRPTYRFFSDDVAEFKLRRAKRDAPCRSISTKRRRSGISTSKCEIIAFTALRDAGTDGKPRR